MNCKKCGKGIPDSENELCEECEKKQNKDAKEATKTEKKKNKKAKENKNENKKNKNTKTTKKSNKNVKEKIFNLSKEEKIILASVVAGILVLCGIAFAIISMTGSKVGNIIGNIRNYGYATEDGKYIYFLSPNEDGTKTGIFRVNSKGEKKKELYMAEDEITKVASINVRKNYIYFIAFKDEAVSEEDARDNKIYRMKLDGSDLQIINDNDFNNNCYEVYVVGNYVYYIGTDSNIYKMKLNGSDRELVSGNKTGYLGITDDYIIYNKLETGEKYTTSIMDLNGENSRPIIEGKRLYSVSVKDNYIYYADENKKIKRTKIGSNEEELVLDTQAYNFNLKDGYMYYLNFKDVENGDRTICIYRLKADGKTTKPECIKELKTYSQFLNVVNDWVFYMDSDKNSAFINLVKIDGSEEKKLYNLNFEDLKQ